MASNIKELIRNGEDSKIEFKKTLSQLEKVAKTLVSFANSGGGTIIIGIQDDKQVVGVVDPHEELFVLQKAALQYSVPAINYSVSETECNGKLVLLVEVKESLSKPHRSKSIGGDWQIYVRSGSQCLLASNFDVNIMETEDNIHESDTINSRVTNNERTLFKFLDVHKRITHKEYARIINVSRDRAFQILANLTLSGRVNKKSGNEGVFFTLR
jgi:predicted HTH transcriptional regulator